jgi:GH18 family chitinase
VDDDRSGGLIALLVRLTSRSLFCFSSVQLVCYYTNWSQYRTKIGKFLPEDIQPDLCTHIIFAFGWLKKNKLTSFESNDETKDGKIGLYERVVNLKKANPSLKVLLAIGEYVRSRLTSPIARAV